MAIRVQLGERSYSIVTSNSYRDLPARLASLALSRIGWVISHQQVLARYGHRLLDPLRRAGWKLETVTVPESERSKSLAMAQRLIARLSNRASMRVPVLFAFGGGVVGDLAGFVAAIYRRGVPYVQVPTTLLAQVDSAIGGKTGVDVPQGKNLIGAFHQPQVVWNHLGVLQTLPMRQRRSGLAEIIKYGIIADPVLFAFMEVHVAECLRLAPRVVRTMVERSSRIKARVVSRDERETTGLRAQLNFGHTLGHALEAAGRYRRWTHGEAIAIGMCAASCLATDIGLLRPQQAARITRLILAVGLPTHATGVSRADVTRALRQDKKFVGGRPRWVLPTTIGRVVVTEDVPQAAVTRMLLRYVR